MSKTIAVITPVYATPENGRLGIFGATVRSVLRQEYEGNVVYVVVDDGSSEDVGSFLQEFRDPRIRYLRRGRLPVDEETASNALNAGIACCLDGSDILTAQERRSLYAVTSVHSDDVLPRTSVARRAASLTDGFVYGDRVDFTNDGKVAGIRVWDGQPDGSDIRERVFTFNHHTLMWSPRFLGDTKAHVEGRYGHGGVFDPLLCYGEDADATLSSFETARERGYTVTHEPGTSVFYRVHQQAISADYSLISRCRQRRRICRKHGIGYRFLPDLGQRLQLNPPWSWFFFLPDSVKEAIRPLRDYLARQNGAPDDGLGEELREILHPEGSGPR